MDHLKELSPGTIWPHLLEAIERDVIEDIRMYAQGRAKDVTRGAETPELAALAVRQVLRGYGIGPAHRGLGFRRAGGGRSVGAREIDPQFEAHLEVRRAARPVSLNFIAQRP
jgi:hypothetical protein